jgi:HEAT repeat protein
MKPEDINLQNILKYHNKRIQNLILNLEDKHGYIRENARETLVAIGKPAIEYLAELLCSSKKILRWEAVKALTEIPDPESAPLYLRAIKDDYPDIRWLAAEGLISLGKTGIIAITESLISDSESVHLQKGAHHVIKEYLETHNNEELKELLKSLNKFDAELKILVTAMKALKSLRQDE